MSLKNFFLALFLIVPMLAMKHVAKLNRLYNPPCKIKNVVDALSAVASIKPLG